MSQEVERYSMCVLLERFRAPFGNYSGAVMLDLSALETVLESDMLIYLKAFVANSGDYNGRS